MQKKWRLFHATDFQTLMYPCFSFCRILGIFPYKINNSILEASKPHYILSIMIICVLCVFELTYEYNIFARNDFENIIESIEVICSFILMDFLLIVTLILNSSRMRLFQTIMESSSKLSPESYQKLSRLIHVKDILGTFYIIGMVFAYLNEKPADALFATATIYISLMIFQLEMLYMNCVCVLKACFKEINNDLLHMQELIVNNEPHVLTIYYYKQKNSFLIMKLKALRKQHIMISNTVQMMNTTFSFQLLTTIAISYISSIFELYSTIVKWHNGIVVRLNEIDINYVCILLHFCQQNLTTDWREKANRLCCFVGLLGMIYSTSKTASIVWACETGKNQAQEIRTTIHDVLNNTSDKRIKNELELFSLQVLHFKNTFSAKGLNIDAKFFATMLGTITTYILIVLQFLIMSHSCDKKSSINIS